MTHTVIGGSTQVHWVQIRRRNHEPRPLEVNLNIPETYPLHLDRLIC